MGSKENFENMLINSAFRYELDPNNVQRMLFNKAADIARFTWNWGLAARKQLYEQKKGKERFTNVIDQNRELNAIKKDQFPWMYEVSKCVPQESLRDLEAAYNMFRKNPKTGLPCFKKKGRCCDSFKFTGAIHIVDDRHVQLPRIGVVRTKEFTTKLNGRILSATVGREGNKWFVSFQVEREMEETTAPVGDPIGVDIGILNFAVLSDGRFIKNSKILKQYYKKLRYVSRVHSRKQIGSNNRKKATYKLAGIHRKIKNIRKDNIHKLTTMLAKNHSIIVIEDLNVREMIKNRRFVHSLGKIGMGMFRTMLEYKTQWYGSNLIIADRFYPSSKTCSSCGNVVDEMPLSKRLYKCANCGMVLDRDLNAARNLVALSSRETLNACGTGSFSHIARCDEMTFDESGSKHHLKTSG